MDSYNFTYKDVLKRYERIINRPSKFEIRLLASILLILTIVNITSLCFADYDEWEVVQVDGVSGIWADDAHNYFFNAGVSNSGVSYFPLEAGYIYRITILQDMLGSRSVVGTSEIPSLNVEYNYLTGNLKFAGDTYSIIGNNTYGFIAYSPQAGSDYVLVERQKTESMNAAVGDLVDNVGISQVWDIFDTGIGFVGVVVIAAFGIFLVVIAIRKMQKGKSEF